MPDRSPDLSILLPTYNGEAFLTKQLDSILDQSFDEFELLILDDGSVDGTRALSDRYAHLDSRVRVIPSVGNRGHKVRLLELIGEARAPLLSIADQDDQWHRERTRRLVDGLGHAAMSFGRSELIDAHGVALGRSLIAEFGPEPRAGDKLTLLFHPRVSAHCMVVRRAAVSELAFRRYQPFDWLMAVEAAFGEGLTYVEDAIVFHRIHGNNQSNGDVNARRTRRERLKPGPVYLELHATLQARAIFVEMLEHLSHSPLLPEHVTRPLLRVATRCRLEWFIPGTGRPYDNPRLRALLRETLAPLAGSQYDWQIASGFIDRMTRSPLHPRTLREVARRVLIK